VIFSPIQLQPSYLVRALSGPRAAIAREKQLKGWTRAKKIALITKTNPTWIDLSEKWYAPELLEVAMRQQGILS
jgi:hypothetical protein